MLFELNWIEVSWIEEFYLASSQTRRQPRAPVGCCKSGLKCWANSLQPLHNSSCPHDILRKEDSRTDPPPLGHTSCTCKRMGPLSPGRLAWSMGCIWLCISVVVSSFCSLSPGVTCFPGVLGEAREYGWNEEESFTKVEKTTRSSCIHLLKKSVFLGPVTCQAISGDTGVIKMSPTHPAPGGLSGACSRPVQHWPVSQVSCTWCQWPTTCFWRSWDFSGGMVCVCVSLQKGLHSGHQPHQHCTWGWVWQREELLIQQPAHSSVSQGSSFKSWREALLKQWQWCSHYGEQYGCP